VQVLFCTFSTPKPQDNLVRIETGVRQGDEVSVHYDPMIAKLVVWGPDRESALMKLHACLAEYNIDGLANNVNFLMDLAAHPEFVKGNVDTDFIPRHYDELFPKRVLKDQQVCAATLAVVLTESQQFGDGLALNSKLARKMDLVTPNGDSVQLTVTYLGHGNFQVLLGDKTYRVSGHITQSDNVQELTCCVDGEISRQRLVKASDGQVKLYTRDQGTVVFKQKMPKFLSQQLGGGSLGDAVAPMPGVVEKVFVQDGEEVKAGDPLVVMIAMKMEYVIKAPKSGKVSKVPHKVGDFVTKGTPLVRFDE